jgi:hypothetical protein
LLALSRFAFRWTKKENRCEAELARKVVNDSERRLPVIIEESAVGAQHAQLQRISALVVGTAAVADLPQIGW